MRYINHFKILCQYLLFILLTSGIDTNAAECEITVDCNSTAGKIKPLLGVNLGPLCYRATVDISPYHKEIGVTLTRLHDVVWLNADAVDISTIFRDFRNDPANPESYDFRITDDYIQAIINTGSKIVYRLGESIEHTPKKYRVNPPPDFEKWAKICLGIISHYNEGWANGFHHNIQYWEIWNEPDVKPAMWTGTDEQYFKLYEITAKAIKSRFPNLKVGGPAIGHPGSIEKDIFVASKYAIAFIDYCKKKNVPIDFFSWHCYTKDPWVIAKKIKGVRDFLDKAGLTNVESHLNEWNYLPDDDWRPMLKGGEGELRERWYARIGGVEGASFIACVLSLMQDLPIDVSNFYTGEIQGFGLFTIHGTPKKNYYAFKAFRQMIDTPNRLKTESNMPRITALAGVNNDKNRINILISSLDSKVDKIVVKLQNQLWAQNSKCEISAVDHSHNLTPLTTLSINKNLHKIIIPINFPSVVLLSIKPE